MQCPARLRLVSASVIYCHRQTFYCRPCRQSLRLSGHWGRVPPGSSWLTPRSGSKESRPHPEPLAGKKDRRPARALTASSRLRWPDLVRRVLCQRSENILMAGCLRPPPASYGEEAENRGVTAAQKPRQSGPSPALPTVTLFATAACRLIGLLGGHYPASLFASGTPSHPEP